MKVSIKHLVIFYSIFALLVIISLLKSIYFHREVQEYVNWQTEKYNKLENKLDSVENSRVIIINKYKDEKIKVNTYAIDDLDSVIRNLSK